jgi:hypothetical protein
MSRHSKYKRNNKEINVNFPLESIYVEGGYGSIDRCWLNRISDKI